MPRSNPPVRGCRDLLGKIISSRRSLISSFASHCERYAFSEIETPILEPATLYRSLGPTSDIVAEETYTLQGCDPPVVLRPEGTAGVLRALSDVGVLRRCIAGGTKVWYAGPMFRRERPQRKRWRQFWQMGLEWVGENGVNADAEVIEVAAVFLKEQGKVSWLRLNTLGNAGNRHRYNEVLGSWLKERKGKLTEMSRRRLEEGNCMRVLDSKLEEDVETLRDAPRLIDYVGLEERKRFEHLQLLLQDAGIDFQVDETLVRGLDYYTSTAFEFDGADGRAVCAGGRYEDVVGGSGVGFAIGLDRIENEELAEESACVEVYEKQYEGGVVVLAAEKGADSATSQVGNVCRKIARELRASGVKAVTNLDGTRLAKAVPRAIRRGAAALIFVGERELETESVKVRFVRQDAEEEGSLMAVALGDVVETVCEIQQTPVVS